MFYLQNVSYFVDSRTTEQAINRSSAQLECWAKKALILWRSSFLTLSGTDAAGGEHVWVMSHTITQQCDEVCAEGLLCVYSIWQMITGTFTNTKWLHHLQLCVSFMVMMHKSLSNWWVFWNQPRMQKGKVAETINRFQPFCFISYLFLWEWSRPPGPPQWQAPSLFLWWTLQKSTSYRFTVVKGRWTSTVLKCTCQITVVKNC